ncbi:hypothetical protein K488DRAFT_85960 [Vararia minispora EC-137]|uniref:Uncharacterized protein n=1 Tax=Vararia minispora EC-137 TaxID=1314806 RepID=A0ACB8QKY0_9AGAM|nr:hypothetical protein K488DRAFT_85960 [Vararia minispora EC-137]
MRQYGETERGIARAVYPPLPKWLCFDFVGLPQPLRGVLRHLFLFLFLIAFGHHDLDCIWRLAHVTTDESWLANKRLLHERINMMCILAGLLVATEATFLTSNNSPLPNLVNYDSQAVYICLAVSFALLLGGLSVGSIVVFIMSKCSQAWFIETHLSSRSRVVCMVFILAYPFLSISAGALLGAIALFIATWPTSVVALRVCAVILLALPLLMLVLFAWTQRPNPSWAQGLWRDSITIAE